MENATSELNAAPELKENSSASGGCSLGCASLFVLAVVVWPALHVMARSYEPEILFVSFVIGGPAFIGGNLLAVKAWRSKSPKTHRLGKSSLRIMWGFVVLFILLLVVGVAVELFTPTE